MSDERITTGEHLEAEKKFAPLPLNDAEQDNTDHANGSRDLLTHRIVVLSLGLTVLMTGLNMTILQALGKETPPALANLGAVAIGALAMTLSSIMKPR